MTTKAKVTKIGTPDDYLNAICALIGLTDAQFGKAVERYKGVGKHLTERESALDRIAPEVFPQGSMLIRTTVRPMRLGKDSVPFDLDSVCRCAVNPETTTSQTLYGKVESRLRDNADFARRLTAEPKCLRLNYESDDFYLDVVPACKDPSDPEGIRILIPNRDKWNKGLQPVETWRRTDPLRFAAWFEAQCEVRRRLNENRALAANVSPVPPNDSIAVQAPLRRVTKLLKRQRDIDFLGDDYQPTSILLTTLAGLHYRGESGTADALERVLDGISAQIQAASPNRIVVPNPTDPAEDLAKPMTAEAYVKFCTMIDSMQRRLAVLRSPRTPTDLGESLKGLAGPRAASAASAEVQDRVERSSERGLVGIDFAAGGLNILTEPKYTQGVQPVRPNTHHLDA